MNTSFISFEHFLEEINHPEVHSRVTPEQASKIINFSHIQVIRDDKYKWITIILHGLLDQPYSFDFLIVDSDFRIGQEVIALINEAVNTLRAHLLSYFSAYDADINSDIDDESSEIETSTSYITSSSSSSSISSSSSSSIRASELRNANQVPNSALVSNLNEIFNESENDRVEIQETQISEEITEEIIDMFVFPTDIDIVFGDD